MKDNHKKPLKHRCIHLSILLVLLATVVISNRPIYAPSVLISGSDFDLYLHDGSQIIMGATENTFVNITTTSGAFNGTSCTLAIMEKSGRLSFQSTSNCTLSFSAFNNTSNAALDIETSSISYSQYSAQEYALTVVENTSASISWRFKFGASSEFWMFCFGLAGVFLMIFAPCWFAYKLRQGLRVADEIIERFVYSLLLFIIGFVLVLTWLGAYM